MAVKPHTVSAVVPCHNHARYLPEALRSIFDQSRPPAEVIVVDDGSDDASASVAAAFDPRVRVIRQARQGIGGARNSGVCAAQGDAIAFLDADDVWPVDSLAVRLAPLDADAAIGCVFGQVQQFISPEVDEAARARLHCPSGAVVARFAGAMLIRRAAFDRVGLFDTALKVGEMMDWAARLSELPVATANVEAIVLRRRIHGANTVLGQSGVGGDYLRVLQASVRRRAAAKRAEAS